MNKINHIKKECRNYWETCFSNDSEKGKWALKSTQKMYHGNLTSIFNEAESMVGSNFYVFKARLEVWTGVGVKPKHSNVWVNTTRIEDILLI